MASARRLVETFADTTDPLGSIIHLRFNFSRQDVTKVKTDLAWTCDCDALPGASSTTTATSAGNIRDRLLEVWHFANAMRAAGVAVRESR
jgi:hypothetical protein